MVPCECFTTWCIAIEYFLYVQNISYIQTCREYFPWSDVAISLGTISISCWQMSHLCTIWLILQQGPPWMLINAFQSKKTSTALIPCSAAGEQNVNWILMLTTQNWSAIALATLCSHWTFPLASSWCSGKMPSLSEAFPAMGLCGWILSDPSWVWAVFNSWGSTKSGGETNAMHSHPLLGWEVVASGCAGGGGGMSGWILGTISCVCSLVSELCLQSALQYVQSVQPCIVSQLSIFWLQNSVWTRPIYRMGKYITEYLGVL